MGRRLKPHPFAYAPRAHKRRHGPQGWSDYRRYREWLRDEFAFRCVFCLTREVWVDMRRRNPIDHFQPQSQRPDLANDYDNLLYTCAGCNSLKSDEVIPDPCTIALGKCMRVHEDGTIEALDAQGHGQMLIEHLRLDDPTLVAYRRKMIGMLKSLARHDRREFIQWMSFPNDLPDLASDPPARNTRPRGVAQSWFAKWQRGKLPKVY